MRVWLFFRKQAEDRFMSISFEKKILNFARAEKLLREGDHICVSVSGGADSLCLLAVMQRLQTETAFHLSAVHINHHLRGQESDGDEAFVRAFCDDRSIPLRVFHCRADEAADRLRCSAEEAGRMLRQEAWRRCAAAAEGMKIAAAHHRNDQAETVLFRAARGTSLAGLGGIRPVQPILPPAPPEEELLREMITEDTCIRLFSDTGETTPPLLLIRPLLCAGRNEIQKWMREQGFCWRTDRTNLENAYARNSIRNELIPLMERQINQDAVRHLAELAEDAGEADRFLREEAMSRAAKYMISGGHSEKACIGILDSLRKEPPVMQRYILMEALHRSAGGTRDLGREQLRQLQELFSLPAGRQTDLPYGICAVREYDGIRLYNKRTGGLEDTGKDREILLPDLSPQPDNGKGQSVQFSLGGWHFDAKVIPRSECPGDIPQKEYTKWLDYDKIKQCLAVRFRREGDWMTTLKDGGRKKLKGILIDSKIPRHLRDRIPLLASGPEIWWITGGRISERAKIRPDTKMVFEITAGRIYRKQEITDEGNDQSFGGRGTDIGENPGAGRADKP